MDGTKVVIGAALITILVGLGWWTLGSQAPADDAMMEKTDEVMMEKDSETMTQNETSAPDVMMDKSDEGAMMQKESEQMGVGAYESYAPGKLGLAKEGKVVLFFRASWCPTCRALDADIRANSGSIPADVTILDVNYDAETALKQKYGVTYQHTMVQVDANGNQIAKWTGSPSLAALVGEIK